MRALRTEAGRVASARTVSGPDSSREATAAVRNLAADSVLRQRLVDKGVGNSLARILLEGPTAPFPTRHSDLILAAEALQRCALAITDSPEATANVRKRLVADGVKTALEAIAKLREGEDEDSENVQRRQQAACHALDALHGKLDVTSRPGRGNSGGGWATLRTQLSSLGTDYTAWSDKRLLSIPRYNAFISHKRSSAQDFARGLHSLIVHNGKTCFIDVENLESLSDLPMVVAGCDLFIFVRDPSPALPHSVSFAARLMRFCLLPFVCAGAERRRL